MADRVVVNSSPLIVLSRAGRIDLLTLAGTPIGAGESAVLEWAQANRPARAIIDDYAARKLASVLAVQVTGTLGLALLARQQGLVPLARPLVEEMARAGLYLSESIIEHALRLVGE